MSEPIYVLNKRLALHQPLGGLRTSIDAVMLGAACPAQNGQTILDLGCGVGSAGLCAVTRLKGLRLTGIDKQGDHIDLARRNAELNGIEAVFVQADLREADAIGSFDHIICNPPYRDSGAHIPSPSPSKAVAIGHDDLELQDWTNFAWQHIKGQGSLSVIHDAGYVDALIRALYSEKGKRRFGSLEIIPLYPKAGQPARRVIIRAWKHRKSPARLLPGLIIHDDAGGYRPEADEILRHCAALA